MVRFLLALEKAFYSLREFLWQYPEYLWGRNDALGLYFVRAYKLSVPWSHFVSAIVISALLLGMSTRLAYGQRGSADKTLIEGVVAGTDKDGNIQSLTKVNPLITTAIQLERDLNELIYEPLIRMESDGGITKVLAADLNNLQEGAEYEFILRTDVLWHDSTPFTVADVIKTLDVISSLDDQNPVFSSNSFVKAVKQMRWERSGSNAVIICTTSTDIQALIPEEDKARPCTGVPAGTKKPIIANFLELLTFKVMPAHLIGDLNTLNIQTPEPLINRLPIGTGKFRFESAELDRINLIRFERYYETKPQISRLQFRLYADTPAAITALQNGEIHTLAANTTDYVPVMQRFPTLRVNLSPVLTNQYWAVYFNMRKDPNGKPIGSVVLQDVSVRRAISAAINRERVLEVLFGVGEEAKGPIYTGSNFFNPNAGWYGYNTDTARQVLQDAGWILNPATGLRAKDNELLTFKLSFVDTPDRSKVVEVIRQDLAAVGIEMIPDPRSLDELTRQVVTPKIFDALLFGMNTFIDPDRYELFHSSQSNNLNLSSYVGSEEASKIEGRTTVRLPRVDKLLEEGRAYNPVTDRQRRKEDYDWFQQLIAADAPVAFLYHPRFIYYANKRLTNLDLSHATSMERRFVNIEDWKVE